MNKKVFVAVFALLMIPILMTTSILPVRPARAWDYTDGTPPDKKYEEFGPRADRLLIKLYETESAEWDSMAAPRGEIDVGDWPLTKPYYEKFTRPPDNESIMSHFYGAEFGLFLLDINWDNDQHKRPRAWEPPDPRYPNEAYPNPCSQLNMRRAIWHLNNKEAWLETLVGTGFYYPLNTVVPPCFGAYSVDMPNPYPYSRDAAIALLESDYDGGGKPDFPIGPDGWRYWDRNNNGEKDPGEEMEIKFFIRSDHAVRLGLGDNLANELEAVKIKVRRIYGPVAVAREWWMEGKKVHLYTAGWGLGVDPDHIILWNSYFYWHPGRCYNTGFVNDTILDETSWTVYMANTVDQALEACHEFQYRFAEVAAAVPWYASAGNEPTRRRYTGGNNEVPVTPDDGENAYRGKYWDGIVNVPGYGPDSYFSFLNMHPRGFEYGDGEHMTIRWGFKTAELRSFNPVYAEWVWEWNVLGLIYDSLLYRNPYDLADIRPWLASSYEVGIYEHPVYGPCTKVVFTLRPDACWSDGTPITVADIYFTFVELDDILAARGLPPPWWYSNVEPILSFSIIDAYNFEVLLAWKSIFAVMYPGGNIILPQHIWRPIAEHEDILVPAADPNLIGSGPWRFGEYMGYSHVLLYANSPGRTVKTNLEGSVPVTNPVGYFRYTPVQLSLEAVGMAGKAKLPYEGTYTLAWKVTNLYAVNTMDILDEGENLIATLNPGETYTLWEGTLDSPYYYWTRHRLYDTSPVGAMYRFALYKKDGTLVFRFRVWLPFRAGPICEEVRISDPLYYVTIPEDIAGSNYYNDIGLTEYTGKKDVLPTPDKKVNIVDVATAAAAFGAYPGHARWSTIADLDTNYNINIVDIARIAARFGWVG